MLSLQRALLLSTGERYFLLVANFVTAALVSRILTPQEIGVSVIGLAIVSVAMSVREFSSATFLIQRESLCRQDIRSACTLTFVLTLGIAMVLNAAAPTLAVIYSEPNLVPYLRVISACLLLDAITLPVTALFKREMKFGKVAFISVGGAFSGTVTTIVLALSGFSYMSFAWAWLVGSTIATTIALVLRPHFWMFKPTLHNWREMIAFGGYTGAIAILYRVFDVLPLLLLGRVVSPHAAALYSRALMICTIPDRLLLSGAMAVALPAFSTEVRKGNDLRHPYLNALSLITAVQWPALLVLSVLAYPAVELMFGPQWIEAAPVVQIVAIALLFSFSFEVNYPVMIALGAIRDLFIRALILFPASGLILSAGIYFGGFQGAAWCMMLTVPFQAFVALDFVGRRLGLGHRDIAKAVWKSAVVGFASAATPLSAMVLFGPGFVISPIQGVGAGLLALVAWVIAVILTRHPLLNEIARVLPAFRKSQLTPAE